MILVYNMFSNVLQNQNKYLQQCNLIVPPKKELYISSYISGLGRTIFLGRGPYDVAFSVELYLPFLFPYKLFRH